ncbi:hypothetical protein HDK77DRAFT_160723 [Phyllosticta capitalensis]|uniref:Uncharacterized protein n=2 Tax=Phyllosticta capitalensis TaxID=121624 RepID=A0ABR1YT14_9PEZI
MWKKHFRARDKENKPPHHQTSSRLKPQDVFDNIQSLRPPPLKPFHNRSHSKASSSIYSQPSPRYPTKDHYSAHNYGDYHVPPVEEHPATRDSDGLNSRFSWSTRATEFQPSPPPSPPPAIPPQFMTGPPRLPSGPDTGSFSGGVFGSTLRHAPSIRTVDTDGTRNTIASAVTTRKPVPSPRDPVANVKRQDNSPSPRVSPVPNPYQLSSYGPVRREVSSPVPSGRSISSRAGTPTTNKNLPPTPALRNLSVATGSSDESASGPKTVDMYQAQVDELYRRRHNITRIIQDLTLSPELTNPLTTDFATKRANERRVKKLEAELADVIREEHDIGMKLHRIRKRQEREEGNDGGMTALWVRRVTTH